MGYGAARAGLAAGAVWLAAILMAQQPQTEKPNGGEQPAPYQNMAGDQRAAATHAFLGLGPEPDKAAAARGAPLFQKNCAVCHGETARGAMGPNLITSDEVLDDIHGEQLGPYIKAGRPGKGMPSFAGMPAEQLRDIAEFLHLQVEEVANRGTYRVLNIVVGDPVRGKAYLELHCRGCHSENTFAHIRSRFATSEQLQRGWVWPRNARTGLPSITATVKTANGPRIAGRVVKVSDFRIVLVDAAGVTHAIDRIPGVEVTMNDPLEPHEKLIMTLKNSDMHDVTAYLETLK